MICVGSLSPLLSLSGSTLRLSPPDPTMYLEGTIQLLSVHDNISIRVQRFVPVLLKPNLKWRDKGKG